MKTKTTTTSKPTISDLLSENRAALRFCHALHGMDFQSPFYIHSGEGSFTYNKVVSAIYADIGWDFVGVVLMRVKGWDDDLHAVVIGKGRFNIEIPRSANKWNYNIDDFYGVGQFEEARKRKTVKYWVIAQSTTHTIKKEEKPVDLSQRFTVTEKPVRAYDPSRKEQYYSKIDLRAVADYKTSFAYKPFSRFYPNEIKSSNLCDYIDKSGYIVRERRQDLKCRALALRADRERAAAKVADFSEKEKEVLAAFEAAKLCLSRFALSATDSGDFSAVAEYGYKMRYAAHGISTYKARKANNDFSSPAAIEKALDNIAADIKKAVAYITGATAAE